MSLDEYRYLWDGSQSGWTLNRVNQLDWSITFHFAETGPTSTEVSAIRSLLDCFRDTPMSVVWSQLRGRSAYTLEDTLGNLEMRWLVDASDRVGLNTSVTSINSGGCIPVHADGHMLIIEDDVIAAQVAQRMIDAGVPVSDTHVD